MNDNFYYDHISNDDLFLIKDFGVLHLSASEAARIVAKILALQGDIECKLPSVPDNEHYSLYDDSLDTALQKQIQHYLEIITGGLERGTLQAAKILRNSDETINPEETYCEMETLAKWLEERSINIHGDWYDQYLSDEQKVAEYVVRAIEIKRRLIIERNYEFDPLNSEEKIMILKGKIDDLLSEKFKVWLPQGRIAEKAHSKPLHTKEKETLLKMAIGMAIKGYGYNPSAKRNNTTTEIKQDLESLGIQLDEDTIRKWLKEASEILPQVQS